MRPNLVERRIYIYMYTYEKYISEGFAIGFAIGLPLVCHWFAIEENTLSWPTSLRGSHGRWPSPECSKQGQLSVPARDLALSRSSSALE